MIRNNARYFIDQSGLSLTDIANKMGVTYNTINKIYDDPTANTTLATIDRLVSVLKCDLNDLLTYQPQIDDSERFANTRLFDCQNYAKLIKYLKNYNVVLSHTDLDYYVRYPKYINSRVYLKHIPKNNDDPSIYIGLSPMYVQYMWLLSVNELDIYDDINSGAYNKNSADPYRNPICTKKFECIIDALVDYARFLKVDALHILKVNDYKPYQNLQIDTFMLKHGFILDHHHLLYQPFSWLKLIH